MAKSTIITFILCLLPKSPKFAIIIRFMRFSRLSHLVLAIVASVPGIAVAQAIPTIPSAMDSTCGILGGLPCVSGGASGLAGYAASVVIPGMQIFFFAAATAFFFYYSIRLILESSDENTMTETKSAYGYAVGGAAIVTLAGLMVEAVGQSARGSLINTAPVITGLDAVVRYFRLILSAVVTLMIVVQGARLVLSQGDESAIEEQKKKFFNVMIGVAVILLANVGISAFIPGTGPGIINVQIVGIINFMLTIFGALTILAVIVGGMMLVVSTDEGLKDRAKKSIFTAVIAMIIVMCSYLIVNFVAFI